MGACHAGLKTCNAEGTAYSECVGEVVPTTESCNTVADDNCNGQINEGCATLSYATDVEPILQQKCSGCHTGSSNSGGWNAGNYSSTQLASGVCGSEHTKGYCMLQRVVHGEMPEGKGCTGDPSRDASNSACLTLAEQLKLADWIGSGQQQ